MRITDLKLYPVGTRRATGSASPHIIVRLGTDGGITGIGEMSDLGHSPVMPDVDQLEGALRKAMAGADPFDPGRIDSVVDRFPTPLGAGIDTAIHDLRGKALGVPVHDLYGGAYRKRYKICYPIFRHRDVSEVAKNVERVGEVLKLGFDLIRLYVGGNLDADELFLRTLKETHGDAVKVKSLDFSRTLDWKSTIRAVERLGWVEPMLVESPCPDLEGMAKVREAVRFPISEHCESVAQAVAFARAQAVDILNIAVCNQGIRRARDLFAAAEALGLRTLIGTTQELSIGTSAQAHLGASVANLDFPGDAAGAQLYIDDVVVTRVKYEQGYLVVPDGPGLGMELDEAKLEALTDREWGFMK
ncbi:MAG: muconate cycloisomerase [Candidatus Latescibacteria bacterium]|nr:muconate cycloisomerase [Candidatus Latescibacterota bacterium]